MSEIVVDAVVSKDVIQQFVDTFTPIVDEAKIHFNEDGVHARAVDPANVAMAFVDLDVSAFESYSSGSVTVGTNLNRLDKFLSVADAGDLVQLQIDMETRKLHLQIRNIDQEFALIDPDAIRQEPDSPDLDLPNTVTIEGRDMDTASTAIEMVSDHIEVAGDPDEKEVQFRGSGDVDASTVTFGRDNVIDADVDEEAGSLYSHDYFEDLAKPIPADAEVTLTFGDDFPIIIEWEASEGHQTTEQMLAPRIKSD